MFSWFGPELVRRKMTFALSDVGSDGSVVAAGREVSSRPRFATNSRRVHPRLGLSLSPVSMVREACW
eukprot:gene9298-biopygen10721